MIIDELKSKAMSALKAGRKDDAALYRLVIGQSQQLDKCTDDNIYNIIRKLIKSNTETIESIKDFPERDGQRQVLFNENLLLSALLPPSISADDIFKFIKDNNIDVKSCKNDGQAVGMVMKEFKAKNITVDGGIVKEVIFKYRK